MTETPEPAVPTVQKKAVNPPGILPRTAQAWLIGGISLLMVLVIAFSGGKESKERSKSAQPPSTTTDPNQARIEEYRARIEEQARRLAAEQAQLAQTRQTLGLTSNAPATPAMSSYSTQDNPTRPTYGGYAAAAPERSWIETENEKREYQALFASNLALSFRADPKTPDRGTSLPLEASKGNDRPPLSAHAEGEKRDRVRERKSEVNRADGKDNVLLEGTVIETVLTNRLDGEFSGPVNCMVTTNVYSHDRQRLLIPQGSRILGEVRRVETSGQQRLAVAFHRLIMPDGYSVSLDQFKGLNQVGETGLRDQVNHHYMQVFGVSLAIGAIAGLTQANTQYGSSASSEDAYRQGVATSLSQSSLRILDRYLNVLPTFTIREGHRVKVYLSGDLALPAYEKHQMPSDL